MRVRAPFEQVLDLPPPFTPVTLRERANAFTHPLETALEQEGFDGASNLTEACARHLMAVTHGWQSDGFDGVAREFVERLPRAAGTHYDIADNGDLLVTHAGRTDVGRSALLPALRIPSWLDPQTGGPRL